MKSFRTGLFFFIFSLILCLNIGLIFAAPDPTVLKVGSVSASPKEETEKYQPFVNYLASRLFEFGIQRGQVVIASSMEEMAGLIKSNEVDLYIDSPFPAIQVADKVGAEIFLRRWKKGVAEYSSVIFVRQESPIQSLEDLRGLRLAFDEPYSTSGYLLPKSVLMKAGLSFSYTALLADMEHNPEDIAYGFSYDPENAIVWVLRGKVDAAVTDEVTYRRMASSEERLRILYKTNPVPRQLVVRRPGLNDEFAKKIEKIMVGMNLNESGKRVLSVFEKTVKFDSISPSVEKQIEEIRLLSAEIRAKV